MLEEVTKDHEGLIIIEGVLMSGWSNVIFDAEISFEEKALRIFEHQFENNEVYRRYCQALEVETPQSVKDIPLLPIQAFKDAEVGTAMDNSTFNIQHSTLVFKSSGTSSMQRSIHRVADPAIYDQALSNGFQQFYDLENAVIWGYTPGYSENPNSSLIYMIQKLIEQDSTGLSRFLPLDEPIKKKQVDEVKKSGQQLILFGAAFGLIDMAENSPIKLPSNSIIIETGGMKTDRREMNRADMHRALAHAFGLDKSRIHSEYGMCELLSQAYATGGKWFRTVPWMRVSVRNPDDSRQILPSYQEGLIGVIDLANVHSCSFLLTGDKGLMDKKGRFQVLGRWKPIDLRGCNFLVEQD